MEINTNPNYLNNVQNQNAQGANSATAEIVVEENLFDGNEANATQNNAVSQDYQNAEMLNTFIAAFTAVMAPFMQMMTQLISTMNTGQQKTNESIIDANNKDLLEEYQNYQNDKDLLKEYKATNEVNQQSKAKNAAALEDQDGKIEGKSYDLRKAKQYDAMTENNIKASKHCLTGFEDENTLKNAFENLDKNNDGVINGDDNELYQNTPLEGLDYEGYVQYLQSKQV